MNRHLSNHTLQLPQPIPEYEDSGVLNKMPLIIIPDYSKQALAHVFTPTDYLDSTINYLGAVELDLENFAEYLVLALRFVPPQHLHSHEHCTCLPKALASTKGTEYHTALYLTISKNPALSGKEKTTLPIHYHPKPSFEQIERVMEDSVTSEEIKSYEGTKVYPSTILIGDPSNNGLGEREAQVLYRTQEGKALYWYPVELEYLSKLKPKVLDSRDIRMTSHRLEMNRYHKNDKIKKSLTKALFNKEVLEL